jgi:hypothetical protein
MKVILDLESNTCTVEREPTDRRIGRSGFDGTDPDSVFLHRVKRELQRQGFKVLKKRMHKDGHMYGSTSTQYIRTSSKKSGFMVYDGDYAIRLAHEDFNKLGKVVLLADTY